MFGYAYRINCYRICLSKKMLAICGCVAWVVGEEPVLACVCLLFLTIEGWLLWNYFVLVGLFEHKLERVVWDVSCIQKYSSDNKKDKNKSSIIVESHCNSPFRFLTFLLRTPGTFTKFQQGSGCLTPPRARRRWRNSVKDYPMPSYGPPFVRFGRAGSVDPGFWDGKFCWKKNGLQLVWDMFGW